MEYRDTHPLTTSRAPLHPRSPLFVTRPLRPPPPVTSSIGPSFHPSLASSRVRVSLYRDFQYPTRT